MIYTLYHPGLTSEIIVNAVWGIGLISQYHISRLYSTHLYFMGMRRGLNHKFKRIAKPSRMSNLSLIIKRARHDH